MAGEGLTVEHILQPAPLCRDIDQTMDLLQTMLGIYPSERIDIKNSGVHNAVYPFDGMTFLELIQPYHPDASAMRLLNRLGEGWHMLSVDLAELPAETVEQCLAEAGVRVVRRNRNEHIKGAWHLHPNDTGGVLLNLVIRADPNDNSRFAGWAWRQYVSTNTRIVRSILGISIATDDLDHAARLYSALGFSFGGRWEDEGDAVLQADCPRGTFLQLRAPSRASAPSATWLARRGPGLFHLALAAPDLPRAAAAVERAGGQIARQTHAGDTTAFWTAPETTIGIPIEFRGPA
jgi:catechol 2,3-dioxygenase-like lactoylglutathione lyase family enzyme